MYVGMHYMYDNLRTHALNIIGMYFTGDGCRRDKDGYYWITGIGFEWYVRVKCILISGIVHLRSSG